MSTVEISISLEQLRILRQILSEACHGIKVFDFENKIGTSKNILNSFLALSFCLYESIEQSRLKSI
ncbi:MAG: hypothetical protein F6K40_33925 [Okeania sp. SIO3I5]|uniref:hypothetical protein n=1 Tax=Okeania sp. SIO3I5 TaxID=2607805 RepID=UPI0013BDD329|nr:hypothetical protein [Okeania sp. SIO3I5]NEQ40946.1 hypothetical protein [Okeania sp. SIO3I5]